MVLWPVCYGNHWILVSAFNLDTSPILGVLDSMGNTWPSMMENFMAYLYEERCDRKLMSPKMEFKIEMKVVYFKTRLQKNGYDCGVFLLTHSEKLFNRFFLIRY